MAVLVTGGAGYIGSHVVDLLRQSAQNVVVVDDLSNANPEFVKHSELIELSLTQGDPISTLVGVLQSYEVTSVIHFAARKQVGESVANPAWYYKENVTGLANLLLAMEIADVNNIVFSSSAAVYGATTGSQITEESPLLPLSPYGETKLIGEWLLEAASRARTLQATSLRYFNVAGATRPALGDNAVMNLIPMVFERLDNGEPPHVFGRDYDTLDGTCVRDYIHVSDLAEAHIAALSPADPNRGHRVYNVGTGLGTSVLEMINLILDVAGVDIDPVYLPRRPGDPAAVIADPTRIRTELDWDAKHSLRDIVESAWQAHCWRKASMPL